MPSPTMPMRFRTTCRAWWHEGLHRASAVHSSIGTLSEQPEIPYMDTEAPSNVLPGRCPIETTSDPTDEPEDIDQGTMKLIVGLIAVSLGAVCTLLAGKWLASISEAYVQGGWARDVFVGSLFSIAAFLLAYLGGSKCEAWLSKIAAVAALGVALFPCNCKLCPAVDEAVRTAGAALASCVEPPTMERVPGVHLASAAVLFF